MLKTGRPGNKMYIIAWTKRLTDHLTRHHLWYHEEEYDPELAVDLYTRKVLQYGLENTRFSQSVSKQKDQINLYVTLDLDNILIQGEVKINVKENSQS